MLKIKPKMGGDSGYQLESDSYFWCNRCLTLNNLFHKHNFLMNLLSKLFNRHFHFLKLLLEHLTWVIGEIVQFYFYSFIHICLL